MRGAVSSMLVLCVALAPVMVQAQTEEPTVRASRKQKNANKRGLAAHKSGDFDKAAALFRDGLKDGDLNLLQLNLGRALQKSGDCDGAEKTFLRALDAPRARGVDPQVVRDKIAEYRDELRQSCPGSLEVQCDPETMVLTIDGNPAVCGGSVSLPPGEHAVVGVLEGERYEETVTVVSFETVEVSATIVLPEPDPEPDPQPEPDPEPEPEPPPSLSTPGWVLTGVGGALLVSGGVFGLLTDQTNGEISDLARETAAGPIDGARAQELFDEVDTWETLQLVGYGLGAACVAAGVVLLVLDEGPVESEGVSVQPAVGPGQLGATLEVRY